MKRLFSTIAAAALIVVGCNESNQRTDTTSESSVNTPLAEAVELAVFIENPSPDDRGRVESRFDYLFSCLSSLCGGTPMQHGSVATRLRRMVLDAGVDESLLELVEQYHRIVTQTGLHNSDQPDKAERCRELLAMYTTLRTNGKTPDEAGDDVVYVIHETGWDKWDLFKDLAR